MTKIRDTVKADVSVVLCGQAGQGIKSVETLLSRVIKSAGGNVFSTKEYMSRIRGGMNSTQIRVSGEKVVSPIDRIDILAALDKGAIEHLRGRISDKTIIIIEQGDSEAVDRDKYQFFGVDMTGIAKEIGGKIYSNTVAAGVICGLLGVEYEDSKEVLAKFFEKKSDEIIEKNKEALGKGFEQAKKISEKTNVPAVIKARDASKDEMLVNGAQAVGMGAIAGGCNMCFSYPMSPSTAVLTFLADPGREFGIIAEQAEDEIAAVNMAIGGWYAGGRCLVTTSGGGFALMSEGISLAGMLETPVVIHLAQRPGPATGLPTRTEQGDLELALYAGHGEFGRILLSPGTLEDCFELTWRAFDMADRFQVPVIILTDQYLMDSYYNTRKFDTSKVEFKRHIVETDEGYRRYELREDGFSARGVPGYGKGLVCVDSDEHDEEGHITEDLELRVKMVDKRLKKIEALERDAVAAELIGGEDFENLVICWGSTVNIVRQALENVDTDTTSILYFKQLNPLNRQSVELIKKAKKRIVVENNATGQFCKLLKLKEGIEVEHRILKYDGLSFSSDGLAGELSEIIGE